MGLLEEPDSGLAIWCIVRLVVHELAKVAVCEWIEKVEFLLRFDKVAHEVRRDVIMDIIAGAFKHAAYGFDICVDALESPQSIGRVGSTREVVMI